MSDSVTLAVAQNDVVRVGIDLVWTAEDFVAFFRALDALYALFSLDIYHPSPTASPSMQLRFLKGFLGERDVNRDGLKAVTSLLDELLVAEPSGDRRPFDSPIEMSSKEQAALDGALAYLLAARSRLRPPTKDVPVPNQTSYQFPQTVLQQQIVSHQYLLNKLQTSWQGGLQVTRIKFASPGFTDLAGIGQIIGHLKEFLIAILKLPAQRMKLEAEAQKTAAEAELISAQAHEVRAKVMANRLEQLQRLNFPVQDIAQIEMESSDHVETLVKLAIARKIISVRTPTSHDG